MTQTRDDEIYERHVRSWHKFVQLSEEYTACNSTDGKNRPTLDPFKYDVDTFGFLQDPLEDKAFNARQQSDDWEGLPLSHQSIKPEKSILKGGTRDSKAGNVTSICGAGYKLFRQGSNFLDTTNKICVFNLRLAQTFKETTENGSQMICPVQLSLAYAWQGTKIRNMLLPPFLDLDDTLTVDARCVEDHIDSQGFVQQSLQNLHYNEAQIRKRIEICSKVLSEMINIKPSEIFAVVSKSKIPGVDFVRVRDDNVEYKWRFAPKFDSDSHHENPKTKIKVSSWLVFGLKCFLEREVRDDEFNDNCWDESSFFKNIRLMMKKQDPSRRAGDTPKIHARGFGILMCHDKLKLFNKKVSAALQEDVAENPDFWLINHTIKVITTHIKVDFDAKGMRLPHASKSFPCCYHELYSGIQQDVVKSISHSNCITKRFKNKNLCNSICCSRQDKNVCPFPTGIHINENGIDPRDTWLLTARCNTVVEVSDGSGESINWCKRLLKHPDFGFMYESSLMCLYVDRKFSVMDDEGEKFTCQNMAFAVPGIRLCAPNRVQIMHPDEEPKNVFKDVSQTYFQSKTQRLPSTLQVYDCDEFMLSEKVVHDQIAFLRSQKETSDDDGQANAIFWHNRPAEDFFKDRKYKKMLTKIDPLSPIKNRLRVNKTLKTYLDEKFPNSDIDFYEKKIRTALSRVVPILHAESCEMYSLDRDFFSPEKKHQADKTFPNINIKTFVHEKDNGKLNGLVVALGPVDVHGFFCPYFKSCDLVKSFHKHDENDTKDMIGPCVVIKYDDTKPKFLYSINCGHRDCILKNCGKAQQPLTAEFCSLNSDWLQELFGLKSIGLSAPQSKRGSEYKNFKETLEKRSKRIKKNND